MEKEVKDRYAWFILLVAGLLLLLMSFPQKTVAETIDVNPEVTFEQVPKTALVGEQGTIGYRVQPIQGVPATGTIRFYSRTPEIATMTSDGHWQAKSPGRAAFGASFDLSDATLDALNQKFPGAEFVRSDCNRFCSIIIKAPTEAVFRLYNPNSGEHFYTRAIAEKNQLITSGWQDEAVGFEATTIGLPVYRVYNPNAGDHHYTTSASEVQALVAAGWQEEGISFYAYDPAAFTLAEKALTPVYRLYNPNAKAGAHHYTENVDERDHLVQAGWQAEGVAWYE